MAIFNKSNIQKNYKFLVGFVEQSKIPPMEALEAKCMLIFQLSVRFHTKEYLCLADISHS